jgi:hypothetical protein
VEEAMRRICALPLTIAWVSTSLLTAAVAAADEVTDIHYGSFFARWCEYDAWLNLEHRDGDSWVFHGHIRIEKTGQFDELFVEQYDDNSLRIIRYLSGPEAGQIQTIQTYPPQVKMIGGKQTAVFSAKSSDGPGCAYTKYTSIFV